MCLSRVLCSLIIIKFHCVFVTIGCLLQGPEGPQGIQGPEGGVGRRVSNTCLNCFHTNIIYIYIYIYIYICIYIYIYIHYIYIAQNS